MKSINLTRNGQTINLTESGEAIVDGRKYKVDIDFESGKVELTYMCEDDGTLSADIEFEKLSFFAEKKTTQNTSKGVKPTITNDCCYLSDSLSCFKCLSENEKKSITNIIVTRDAYIENISDLFFIAENSIYAMLELINVRSTKNSNIKMSLQNSSDMFTLEVLHENGFIDIKFDTGNSITNQLFSYIVSKLVEAGNLQKSLEIKNSSTQSGNNLLYGVEQQIADTKNIKISSQNVIESIQIMQLLRFSHSLDSITVNVDNGSILSVIKGVDGYELRLETNKIGNDVVDTLIYLYKAFMSIISINNLKDVYEDDLDGNAVLVGYSDDTDFRYDTIDIYGCYGFYKKGYCEDKTYSIKYVKVGYGINYFCDMGDEKSKFKDINYIKNYAKYGYFETADDVLKDKTNKLLQDSILTDKNFLDINISKTVVLGTDVTSDDTSDDTSDVIKKVSEKRYKDEKLSIFQQAKRGIKVFQLNYLSPNDFCKLVRYGATYIKTREFIYIQGEEMHFYKNDQTQNGYLTCADVPKVTGNFNPVCSYNKLPKLSKSIKSLTSRYLLESYYCTNRYGSAFLEDMNIFMPYRYPIAYKYLDECILRHDNGALYVSTTEKGLIRDKITKYVQDGTMVNTKYYLVNFLLQIVSIDRVTNATENYNERTNSIRTFKDGFPRPLKSMPLLNGYIENMSNADRSFIYAFIEAMKFFDNKSMRFTKHFSSLFNQLMDGNIYVYVTKNFVFDESNYTKRGDGVEGVHLFASKSEGERYTRNGALCWDISYKGKISIELTQNNYKFKSVSISEPSVKKHLFNGIMNDGDITMTSYINLDDSLNTVSYFLNKNDDGSVTITWNNTGIEAKFFQIGDKKIKVGD